MRDNNKILSAKLRLYSTLLDVPYKEQTTNEIDIAFSLSKDEQVQKFFDENLAKERRAKI